VQPLNAPKEKLSSVGKPLKPTNWRDKIGTLDVNPTNARFGKLKEATVNPVLPAVVVTVTWNEDAYSRKLMMSVPTAVTLLGRVTRTELPGPPTPDGAIKFGGP
jgi:hypothetical protein